MGHRAGQLTQAQRRAQIAARARSQPKEKFSNLLHHLTPELITQCLSAIPGKSAAGVDEITVEEVKANLSWMLPPILKEIHQGRYQAPPVRRVYIPKPDGRKRPLGIPTVLDRAIQAAMAQILNQIYEQTHGALRICTFDLKA
jgi:retron-type reverse transcriptase